MITNDPAEGGAGITPKRDEWKEVESIFPLHDHAFNKKWIKSWSSSSALTLKDHDDIRNRLGEKVSISPYNSSLRVCEHVLSYPYGITDQLSL